MGLITRHSWCASSSLTKFESKSRLLIPEFSGYHCMTQKVYPYRNHDCLSDYDATKSPER